MNLNPWLETLGACLVDHYVAILEVTDREVVVGDPFSGKRVCTHEQFRKKWRYAGIVLQRKP